MLSYTFNSLVGIIQHLTEFIRMLASFKGSSVTERALGRASALFMIQQSRRIAVWL